MFKNEFFQKLYFLYRKIISFLSISFIIFISQHFKQMFNIIHLTSNEQTLILSPYHITSITSGRGTGEHFAGDLGLCGHATTEERFERRIRCKHPLACSLTNAIVWAPNPTPPHPHRTPPPLPPYDHVIPVAELALHIFRLRCNSSSFSISTIFAFTSSS